MVVCVCVCTITCCQKDGTFHHHSSVLDQVVNGPIHATTDYRIVPVQFVVDRSDCMFYLPLKTKQVISETLLPANLLSRTEELNLTQQMQLCIRNTKILYHKINGKKLKPGLVMSYDLQPGNREGYSYSPGAHKGPSLK